MRYFRRTLALCSCLLSGCFDPLIPSGTFGTIETDTGPAIDTLVTTTESEPVGSTTGEEQETAEDTSSMDGSQTSKCGNGLLDPGEQCDDAGESSTCDIDCTMVQCGDGTLNRLAGESCEEGGEQTETCDTDCTAVECGDGTLNSAAGEQCDDAGESTRCDIDCTLASCGDGIVNTTALEFCDDRGPSAACDDDCTPATCGDGLLNSLAGETCDDGNVAPGDGCDPSCLIEVPEVCFGDADPLSGALWVVCSASATEAWIAHALPGGGEFHPELICASLGYASVGEYGGTCDNICGYCQSGTSCLANGDPIFDSGGDCGMDEGGIVLCPSVHWQCTNP